MDSHNWTCIGKCSSIVSKDIWYVSKQAISIGRDTNISI